MTKYLQIFLVLLFYNHCVVGQIKTTQEWFDSGISLFKQNKYTEAISCFNYVIKEKPDHADAIYYKALSNHFKKEYDLAGRDFRNAYEIDSRICLKSNTNKNLDTISNDVINLLWLARIIAYTQNCTQISRLYLFPLEIRADSKNDTIPSESFFTNPEYYYTPRVEYCKISLIMIDTLPLYAIIDNIPVYLSWENGRIAECKAIGDIMFDYKIEYDSLSRPIKYTGSRRLVGLNNDEVTIEYINNKLYQLTAHELFERKKVKQNIVTFDYSNSNTVTVELRNYKKGKLNSKCDCNYIRSNDTTFYINSPQESCEYIYNKKNQLQIIKCATQNENRTVELIYVDGILWQEKEKVFHEDSLYRTKYINHFSMEGNKQDNDYNWRVGYYILDMYNDLIEEGRGLWSRKRKNSKSKWVEYLDLG